MRGTWAPHGRYHAPRTDTSFRRAVDRDREPVAGRGRTQKLLPELERAGPSRRNRASQVSPEPGARPSSRGRPTKVTTSSRAAVTGSSRRVAGVAADTGRRLAIVPTGAGNDFACVLGYDPKHPLAAFEAIAHGRDRSSISAA